MSKRLVCLCLCLISCVSAFGQQPAPAVDAPRNVVGTWEGTLHAGTAKIKLVLYIEAAKDSGLVGRLDVPDQGAKDLPIDSLLLTGNTLKFEMKSLAATYEGKLDSNGNQISGEFRQGGQAFPLVLDNTARTAPKGVLAIRKVAAGGHALSLLAGGEGSPTIVFEAGFGAGPTAPDPGVALVATRKWQPRRRLLPSPFVA